MNLVIVISQGVGFVGKGDAFLMASNFPHSVSLSHERSGCMKEESV